MSHFTVMVINSEGENDVEKQLQPFHEYECTGIKDEYVKFVSPDKSEADLQSEFEEVKDKYNYDTFEDFMRDYHGYEYNEDEKRWGRWTNPNRKWDWYQIGGRWAGKLKLKSSVVKTRSLLKMPAQPNFSWGWDDESRTSKSTGEFADVARKGHIDWESMMNDAALKYEEMWDTVANIMGINAKGHIRQPKYSWDNCRGMFPGEHNKAREFYHKQPIVELFNTKVNMDHSLDIFASIEDFDCTRAEYGQRGADNAISTYAVLKDGEWISKGEMGWFGMSSESDEEAKQWSDGFFENFIKPLDDNALITIVDCHI